MTGTWREHVLAVLGPATDPAMFGTHSFVALGGDSLAGMRLAALSAEHLDVRVPLATLLGDVPLAEVFADVSGEHPAPPRPAATEPVESGLSHAQRGMWLIESLTGGSPYNLVFLGFVESGALDPARFAAAVRATVARHPGLRTVYRESDGAVAPEVLADPRPRIDTIEVPGPVAGFADGVRKIAAEHGRQPFDLAAEPALRFLFLTHAEGRQAVVLLAHHMVLDGWAVGLLLTEVTARYSALDQGGPDPFPEPGVGATALLAHQESARVSGEWDRQTEFWIKQLDGVPSVLELPADQQRPAIQDSAGARTEVDLGVATSTALAARARELGITPFALLLGAFGLTLSRWTGARSLLIGVPLTGRGTAELERLVAVAGNLVPVRIEVDDGAPVAEFLRAVHRSLTHSIDAGGLPFEELVARLGIERSLGCHPLVQACFGMHDQLVPQRLTAGPAELRIEEGHGGGSQFDLTLLIGRSVPALAGQLEYATSVWRQAEADAFVADFTAAATELAAAGDGVLENVRCCAPERRDLLDAVNATRTGFPKSTVDELFRAVARRTPDAVAVREHPVELTYAQLADAAAHQARLLREAGVRPGDTVLVALDRSVAEAVALLGIAWAGAAYVGIDLSLPAAHTAQILARATPAAVLGPASGAALDLPVVPHWDDTWQVTGSAARVAPAVTGDPDRLAYVAFTSGSTGAPKGVSVPQRAVIRLVHEADFVRLGPGERVLRFSPLAFDASTLEIWGALLSGATLEVHPAGLPSPTELGAFLVDRGVTVAWLTAGLFRLVEEFSPDSLAGLRQLLTGGDVVPHEHAARALRRHPGLVITNGYGPTENTTFTATHSVREPAEIDGPLPIGRPVPGTRVYIVDERNRLVPPGAVGELCAGGLGLADGYRNDPAETARRFGEFSLDVPERLYRTGDLVRLDTQGRLRFLGRTDDQVKLRGYRIELSAISDALTAHPDVHDAVVAVTDGDSSAKRLVAAVVPVSGRTADPARLRADLAEALPSYMVPTLWAVMPRIPLTANGKVDRRALLAQAAPAGAVKPPTAEESLTALFAEAIEQPDADFAEDTDFFTVGGNSLAAVRLIRLVKQRLEVVVRLREFLPNPTPAGLRALITKARQAKAQ